MEALSPISSTCGRDTRRLDEDPEGLDLKLYSRQVGAFGLETMKKLSKLHVYILGLDAAGIEAAKNLVLAGVQSVTIHDNTVLQMADLGFNSFVNKLQVGCTSRAAASHALLQRLNDYVAVTVDPEEPQKSNLAGHNVLLVSGISLSQQLELNELCRNKSPTIAFISITTFGLACSLFVDFGDQFTVLDPSGEQLPEALIDGITSSCPGVVHLNEEKINPFQEGDWVTFSEVQGMTELNSMKPVKIKNWRKYSFDICDTTSFSPYDREGIVRKINMPKTLRFKSLKKALQEPIPDTDSGFIQADFSKPNRPEQLHLAFQAVYEYERTQGWPALHDDAAAQKAVDIAHTLHSKMKKNKNDNPTLNWAHVVDTVDDDIVKKVALFAQSKVAPLGGFIGSIAAQEVVKFTQKFTPLRQFFYFDAFEAFSPDPVLDAQPCGSRYDHQISIWGKEFCQKLAQLNLFIVGVGALGCELLKYCAFLGCCLEKEKGCLSITDMDRIEVSNLNRQFIFQRESLGKSKSLTAAQIVKSRMNPEINIKAYESRVGPETENVFDDEFWEKQDVILNALDNINSRLYIDGRCVWFKKPLLESGTLGTKGNTQVILPFLTQSYGDSRDPPEQSIPLCTLRHFPNQIEHTIEWARDAFEGLFCSTPMDLKAYLESPEKFLVKLLSDGTESTRKDRLKSVYELLKIGKTFKECALWAVDRFTKFFDHDISQLLHTFPLDHVTSSGQPFWTGPKRAPAAIKFDSNDKLHISFVTAAANLLAYNLNIPQCHDLKQVAELLKTVTIQPFVPKVMKYKIDENDTTIEGALDDGIQTKNLQKQLEYLMSKPDSKNRTAQPAEFEKDEDSNYHIDFIWACANLRARNYRIPECSRNQTKMIAGKIIPAIATTTAMITSLVILELIKIVTYKKRPLDNFKNAFIGLGINFYCMSEPDPAIKTIDKDYDPLVGGPMKARPLNFTSWDNLTYDLPDATVENVIEALKKDLNVDALVISVGNMCVYNAYLSSHKNRLKRPIKEIMSTTTQESNPIPKLYVVLEASCVDCDDGVDVMIPTIKVNI